MRHKDNEEVLDVVNENDEVIGTISRANMMDLKETPGRYLRAVEIFIQRPNGDIFLPRRSKLKKIAPGGFDLSVSGHLTSGETYEAACIRETKEEAGIDAGKNDFILLAKLTPTTHMFYFRKVFLLQTSQAPHLGSEHTEAVWSHPDQLKEVVSHDIPTKEVLWEDMLILLDHLQNNSFR